MFEEAMIETGKKSRKGKWGLLVPMAAGMHVLLGGALAFAAYWAVEALPEPFIQVAFVAPLPPPPKAAAPPLRRNQIKRPRPIKPTIKRAPLQPVQPMEVPDNVPEPQTPQVAEPELDDLAMDTTDGEDFGVVGGVKGGEVDGVVGGVPDGVSDSPILVQGAVTQPEVLRKVQPKYTDMARRARIQGVVVLEAIIDRSGNVVNARVLRGLGGGLSESALDAIHQWKFKPATLNGRPVTVYFTLTVKFSLQ